MEDNWISVKEKLPDYYKKVWAWYFPPTPQMQGRIFGVVMRLPPSKHPITKLDDNGFTYGEVTHWMPIPSPPKV